MTFEHRLRVRYAEVDAQGVVFNAHWLTYFDDAMTRYFDALGYDPKVTWSDGGPFDVMLVASRIEWRGPAGFDDEVRISVAPARLGRSSFDLAFTARVEDREVVTATTTYVCIDHATHAAQALPDELRARLVAHLPDHGGATGP
jgi:acyl-CoA thioester hydrolase